MDQAARTSGPAVEEGQRTPEEIREDIADTREELGDTVETLAAKTDVKAQARARLEGVKEKVSGAKDGAADRTPSGVSEGFEQLKTTAGDKPVPTAAIAAFVAGLLIGRFIYRES